MRKRQLSYSAIGMFVENVSRNSALSNAVAHKMRIAKVLCDVDPNQLSYSVYFFEFPWARWAGYFLQFCTILASAAVTGSMPRRSEMRIR